MKNNDIQSQSAVEKAKILVEALPYMQQFRSKTIVIKYDGEAMVDASLQKQFALDVVMLKQVGINPVIVHGGAENSPQYSSLIEQLGKKLTTIESLEMLHTGKINKQIVSQLNVCGGKAIGLSGRDGDLICAYPVKPDNKKGAIPYENFFSGNITNSGAVSVINTAALDSILTDFIPIIAPIGVGINGEPLILNPAEAAAAIAKKLQAEKLMLLTDAAGIQNTAGKLLPRLPSHDIDTICKESTISEELTSKLHCCKDALQGGVNKTYILDGRVEHSVLLEILTPEGVGTEIY